MKKEEITEIGWCVESPIGDFVFSEPYSLQKKRSTPISRRSVQSCPAVNEFEKRLFVINCSFDIRLRIEKSGNDIELYTVPEGTKIDDDLIPNFVSLNRADLWREKNKPVIQILLPYFFICDEICYLSQISPFLDFKHNSWPGVIIGGRFPITNWPRILNFAFEWVDIRNDLILRRGDPLCYVFFELDNPEKIPKLVQAKITPELREFRKGIQGAPKFVSNTFHLMKEAKNRRPKKLLEKK